MSYAHTIAETIGPVAAERQRRERAALTLLRLRRPLGTPDPGAPRDGETYAKVAGLLIAIIRETGETPDAICRRLGITAARRQRLLKGQTNGGQWFRGHSPFAADTHGRPLHGRNAFDPITGEAIRGPLFVRSRQNITGPPVKVARAARRINGQRVNGVR